YASDTGKSVENRRDSDGYPDSCTLLPAITCQAVDCSSSTFHQRLYATLDSGDERTTFLVSHQWLCAAFFLREYDLECTFLSVRNSEEEVTQDLEEEPATSPPPDPEPSGTPPASETVETQEPAQQQEAVCKYRWAKVVPTNCQRIIFFSSAHPKDPVFLHWSEENAAFFSEEKHVPCGDYAGHVIVEGKTYPVEGFGVRSYTFEVDLFIKEARSIHTCHFINGSALKALRRTGQGNVAAVSMGPAILLREMSKSNRRNLIEDEVATSNSLAEEIKFRTQQQQYQKGSIDTYKDISTSALTAYPRMEENGTADENGIRHNSKYEELLRQQLQHKESLDASLENELALSQKSDHSLNGSAAKRLTPVGDVDKETFQDGYTDLRQEYDLERCSVKSEIGSSRHSSSVDAPIGGDVPSLPKSPKSPSRAGSDYSGVGSGRPTPQREFYSDEAGVPDMRRSPVRSAEGSARQSPMIGRPGSHSSGRRTPVDTRIDDVLGSPGSRSSPVRQTPTCEAISDVLGGEVTVSSPVRSLASGSARQTPDRELAATGSAHSSLRGTPQRETLSAALRSSQERLYSSQDLPPAAGERSQSVSITPSRHSSRAQSLSSLTSEQELSQYLDTNNSKTGSEAGRTPVNFDTHPDESATLPPIMRERDRPTSLPVYSSQSPAGVDRRSFTPDHRTWSNAATEGGEPGLQRDLASRTTPRSAVSSRTSSRTVTPVNIGGLESQKVRELEDTIATLRKLLGSREQEVHELTAQIRDLKDINQSLKRDLEHAKSRRTPTGPEELERQYQQLLKEKEILAAEVVKLRDRLEASRGSKVDSFSPNSTTSQQRRIDELEAHIRDLRQSSDLTVQKLTHSELRIRELLEENDKLRSSKSLHVQDLQDERGGRHGDRQYMIEIQQLKEDVRTLRDRNYALQDENLKLKEGREPLRSSEMRSSLLREAPPSDRNHLTSSIRSEDGVLHRPPPESSSLRDGVHRTSDHIAYQSRSHALLSPCHNGARAGLDRSYGSDSFPVSSSRDALQRSPDRSFGSDHEQRDAPTSYSRSRLETAVVDKERLHASDRLKYRDLGAEQRSDLRRTDPGRYDLLRSRPDGEVSEKLHATDGVRYSSLSSEHLKSFNRERERERDRGETKISMSAERLRILEEAERDRERRALAGSASVGQRTRSAANPVSSQDLYQYRMVRERIGRSSTIPEHETYSVVESPYIAGSNFNTSRQRRLDNLSDDSDSTAVLMSYNAKTEPPSNTRDRERSSYSERGKWTDTYTERMYMRERERDVNKDRDYRDAVRVEDLQRPYKETNGDDSDTATDILLNAEPSTNPGHTRRRHRRSSGSDASLSSLSDCDDPPESLRRRSRSADHKGKRGNPSRYGQTTTLRPAASAERLAGGKTVTLSTAGFRSVTPQPLTTQHNRGAVIQQMQMQAQQQSLASSLTQGLRPFAPRAPADVRPEDVVKFSRQGGKLSQGTVKFVGHLPGRTDVYLGVELYKEEGKHDGTFEGIRYFKCKPNKGVFVAFNKVVMAWAPN
ncbi:hypothetical protein BaRGS_00014437, partial [Batillaria attramentaria]